MMFLKTINSILTLVFLNIQLSCQVSDQKIPPNVLMISIDDLNDWIGILGAHPDVKTPNIDRLANEGSYLSMLIVRHPFVALQELQLCQDLDLQLQEYTDRLKMKI